MKQRNFFSEIWREFWRGSRASASLRTRGVGRFVSPFLRSVAFVPVGLACVPACGRWACPVGLSDSQRQGKTSALPLPSLVPCNQFSPQNGLLYYIGRENGSTGLKWASVGLLLNRLRACPVKKGRKGEISLTCSACSMLCICRPVSLGLSCSVTVTDRDKKSGPVFGSLSWCGVVFLLSI